MGHALLLVAVALGSPVPASAAAFDQLQSAAARAESLPTAYDGSLGRPGAAAVPVALRGEGGRDAELRLEPRPRREAAAPGAPKGKGSGSDAGWLVPTLGGAALFVCGVAAGGTGGSLLALLGVGLLVYGLVKGVRKDCGTINGTRTCG